MGSVQFTGTHQTMKMALNLLNVRALWTGCTLTLLFLVTGTEGNIITAIYNALGRCPVAEKGYFVAPGTGQAQCFKVVDLDEEVTWGEADQKCKGLQLKLARPYNARDLSDYLFQRYSKSSFWMAGQGNGVTITWRNEGPPFEELNNNNPLYEKKPVDPQSSDCLVLRTDANDASYNPEKPYITENCFDAKSKYTLCEVVVYSV